MGGQGAAGGGRPGERPGGHRGYRLTFFRLFQGRPTPFAMFGGDFWRAGREGGGGQLLLNPSASFPTSAEITHTRPHFLTTVPQNGQVGVWEIVFVSRAGPRPIPKSAIIDERGSKISEDLIYFCDSGSPFSEKMCQNCCKGCQILTSRSFLADARGCSRMLTELVREVRPGTYLPHAPGVRMT